VERLSDRREAEELRIAIVDMLAGALETQVPSARSFPWRGGVSCGGLCQPGLAELFINPGVRKPAAGATGAAPAPIVLGASAAGAAPADPADESCMPALQRTLREGRELQKRVPRLVARTVHVMYLLWKYSASHRGTVEMLRKSDAFWKELLALVPDLHDTPGAGSLGLGITLPTPAAAPAPRVTDKCEESAAATWALRTLALDIAMTGKVPHGADAALDEFGKRGAYARWITGAPAELLEKASASVAALADELARFGLALADLRRQRVRLEFGHQYVFDETALARLRPRSSEIHALVTPVRRANRACSLADAALQLLTAQAELIAVDASRAWLAAHSRAFAAAGDVVAAASRALCPVLPAEESTVTDRAWRRGSVCGVARSDGCARYGHGRQRWRAGRHVRTRRAAGPGAGAAVRVARLAGHPARAVDQQDHCAGGARHHHGRAAAHCRRAATCAGGRGGGGERAQ
jgi:hypothetical protein